MTRALHNYGPPVLQWLQENETGIFGAFLSRWPPLKAAQLARRTTLEHFFRAHPGRAADVIMTRIEAIKSAVALTTATGGITPNALVVHAFVAQLRGTVPAMADGDTASAAPAQGYPDFPVFDALPGAGAVVAPRLLVAFGEPRERYASAEDRPHYAGIAPVTARCGKKSWGHGRLQCPKCLRHTFVEWAAESIRHSYGAPADSQQQRDKGKAHQAAVRAFAITWRRSR